MGEAQKSARRVSLFLLLVFVAIYSGCAEVTSLRCSRADGACLLTQETLLRTRRTPIRVADLVGAHVDRTIGVGKSQGGTRTILDTRQGPVSFHLWKGSGVPDVSDEVRSFVRHRKEAELLVTFDSRLKVLGAGSFFLVGSALLFGLSFAKSLTTTGTRRRSRDVEGAPGRGAVT